MQRFFSREEMPWMENISNSLLAVLQSSRSMDLDAKSYQQVSEDISRFLQILHITTNSVESIPSQQILEFKKRGVKDIASHVYNIEEKKDSFAHLTELDNAVEDPDRVPRIAAVQGTDLKFKGVKMNMSFPIVSYPYPITCVPVSRRDFKMGLGWANATNVTAQKRSCEFSGLHWNQ
ncbi:hypothetical protein M422DRAFT_47813 [Sphaerobolus stellatus SS14]|uniref:Uncharacterized protein n=1 Tax=Sphaerobolus stellatus (strain SS14) TaxID=990650 RepID=A0A0C9V980_SPHS4|nr:hypothetical protein M422DRAFT_47813 [Sphaerobolus stellatus SS14]